MVICPKFKKSFTFKQHINKNKKRRTGSQFLLKQKLLQEAKDWKYLSFIYI